MKIIKSYKNKITIEYTQEELEIINKELNKKGCWIKIERQGVPIYRCSACMNDFIILNGAPEKGQYNYCPQCGSKMECK